MQIFWIKPSSPSRVLLKFLWVPTTHTFDLTDIKYYLADLHHRLRRPNRLADCILHSDRNHRHRRQLERHNLQQLDRNLARHNHRSVPVRYWHCSAQKKQKKLSPEFEFDAVFGQEFAFDAATLSAADAHLCQSRPDVPVVGGRFAAGSTPKMGYRYHIPPGHGKLL